MENRNHPRIKVTWPVTIITDDRKIGGETRNISESGILISTSEPLRLNEIYQIALHPPGHEWVELGCTVIWSDLYGIDPDDKVYGIGFCFVRVSEADFHKLKEVLPSTDAP